MFESILESVINKVLGDYIQNLNKQDLKVSLWGGDIELRDIMLKTDIFQKFKLPLDLVYGQIGHLKIQVPWKKLGSNPVNVEITDIKIVVRPKTDPNTWQMIESKEIDFTSKDELISEMALQMFTEMIKTAEEKAKDSGMMSSLVTKIVDNLQIKLTNMHIRIENEDAVDRNNQFSLGVTLQGIDLHTTDDCWERIFIDRTKEINKEKSMFKLLKIVNFGVYYKTKETCLISTAQSQEEMAAVLTAQFSTYDEDGRITRQHDDYLIEPIRLEVKLTQNDPVKALKEKKTLTDVFIMLDQFGIVLQKAQYDNIQMLLELTSDYMRFLNYELLTKKKELLKDMQNMVVSMGEDRSKKRVKELYQATFSRQLDLVIATDPKKKEKLDGLKAKDLQDAGQTEIYSMIVRAIDSVDLQNWAREIVSKKAAVVKLELEEKRKQKGKGFFRGMFSRSKKDEEEVKDELMAQESLEKIEKELAEQAEQFAQVKANEKGRQSVPNISLNFILKKTSLTLVDNIDDFNGLSVVSDLLQVKAFMYDASNKYNPKKMELEISQDNFGVWVVQKDKTCPEQSISHSPFLQQINGVNQPVQEGSLVAKADPFTKIKIALGNVTHHESDLPAEEIDETDLDLDLRLKPVEIIYRAASIMMITKFFKVKHLKDQTKLAAKEQFQGLTKQVQSITQNLEADFKNNKIVIKIDSPIFVLPHNQTSWEDICKSEVWLFTMGDVSLISYTGEGFDYQTHEAFKLLVENMKFEYGSQYSLWKEFISGQIGGEMPKISLQTQESINTNSDASPLTADNALTRQESSGSVGAGPLARKLTVRFRDSIVNDDNNPKKSRLRMVKILEDFSTQVLLLKRRSMSEMQTKEMKKNLKESLSAVIEVRAAFKDEMRFCLRPTVFKKLTKIGTLFVEKKKMDEYYQKRMLKKLDKAEFFGNVRIATALGEKHGTAALVLPDKLYFWPEDNPEGEQLFDLSGCEQGGGLMSNGLDMVLTNQFKNTFEMRYNTHKQTERWFLAMSQVLQEIIKLKAQGAGIPLDSTRSSEKSFDFNSTADTESVDVPDQEFILDEAPDFAFSFEAPKIVLALKTRKKVILHEKPDLVFNQATLNHNSQNDQDWELLTFFDQIEVQMQQKAKKGMNLKASVKALQVSDNSGDKRFPFIFQNLPAEGQQNLVSFKLNKIEKTAANYVDCETFVDLGFGGLIAYWKPQTMVNLLEFINENQDVAQAKQKARFQNEELSRKLREAKLREGEEDLNAAAMTQKIVQSEQKPQFQAPPAKKHKGCLDKSEFTVKVSVRLAFLKSVFIHPFNNTYPLFTLHVHQADVDVAIKCDCIKLNVNLQNFQIMDNTAYPETLDPLKHFTPEDELFEQEILGLNMAQVEKNGNKKLQMLALEVFIFQFPSEDRCENQPSQDFNMLIRCNLQQIKLLFMMQNTMRMVQYLVNHVGKLFGKIEKSEADEIAPVQQSTVTDEEIVSARHQSVAESEFQSFAYGSENDLEDDFWADFDLKQQEFVPCLDLKIGCPLIIVPNLADPTNRFQLDFGTITITSSLMEEKGRWINHPQKLTKSMAVNVRNENLRFDFKVEKDGRTFEPIFKEDEILVEVFVPNPSPFVIQEVGPNAPTPLRVNKEGNVFDMSQLDVSVSILIKQSLLKLSLQQDVITELFNTLEHNVIKTDPFSSHFENVLQHRRATIVKQMSTNTKAKQRKLELQNAQKQQEQDSEGVGFSEEEFDSDMSLEEENVNTVAKKRKNLKKRTTQIRIQATCLSIELREKSYLICEFCMVNFDYGLEIFADKTQRIYMNTHSFFIFHDEDPMTLEKQVMFGHHDSRGKTVTDEQFYHALPDEIRKQYGASDGSVDPKSGMFRFDMMLDPVRQLQQIKVEMRYIKFFVRPLVFQELSQFTITALQKLDLKKRKVAKENQDSVRLDHSSKMSDISMDDGYLKQNPHLDQGSRQIIKLKMSDSMLVLERKELIKKAVVIRFGMDMNMEMNDQLALERQLTNQKIMKTSKAKSNYKLVSSMGVKIKDLTPYAVNIRDLEEKKFENSRKRELMNGIRCDTLMEVLISKSQQDLLDRKSTLLQPPNPKKARLDFVKFKTKNTTEVSVSPIYAQVSMDDLYIVQQLSNKVTSEFLEVGNLWKQYNEASVQTAADKKRKMEQDIPTELILEFICDKGADIVIINEERGNFVPLILLSASTITFAQNSGLEEQDRSEGNCETRAAIFYYNAQIGQWEPAIERFEIQVLLESEHKTYSQSVRMNTPININVSVEFAGVLSDFQRLWDKSNKKALEFQKRIKESNRFSTIRDAQNSQSFNARRSEAGAVQGIMLMNDGDSAEAQDVVTPFAIRNLTDRPFKVVSLVQGVSTKEEGAISLENKNQHSTSGNTCSVKPGEKQGLAVSFGDTLESSMSAEGHKQIQAKDQIVRIDFESRRMVSLDRFKLNQNVNLQKHEVFQKGFRAGQTHDREFYVIQNRLEDKKRILTVRTQHILVNKTPYVYKMRLFFVEKALVNGKPKKEVLIYYETTLKPGDSAPIPEDKDEKINDRMKICVRPVQCKKWSDEFKVRPLKQRLVPNSNVMWCHYKTYTILRKVPVENQRDVFNFCLLPAMIIKNCLPIAVNLSMSQEQKNEQELKDNNRIESREKGKERQIIILDYEQNDTEKDLKTNSAAQASKEIVSREKLDLGMRTYGRGEEQILDHISSLASSIDIFLHLDDRFQGRGLRLWQANEAKEAELKINFRDPQGRKFPIWVNIQTETAGNKVVFFARNVLLCHTEIKLAFFYEKKQKVFEQDNANEFPEPIRDKDTKLHQKDVFDIEQKQQSQLQTIKQRNDLDQDEPRVYIFSEDKKTLCARIDGLDGHKSDLVSIANPGDQGKFAVEKDKYLFEFACSTATYQPSEKENIFTKIVEVSPLYIVCNLTSHRIFFSQAHVKVQDMDSMMIIDPQERRPYHWIDSEQPKLSSFFIDGVQKQSAPFSLSDVGSLAVKVVTVDGARHFFKVNKRNAINSVFIVIEELEYAPYKIDNLCRDLQISFCQQGTKNVEDIQICPQNDSRSFLWQNLQEEFRLNVEFLLNDSSPMYPIEPQKDCKRGEEKKLLFSLDTLNATQKIGIKSGGLERYVYISVYTDEHQKIFEVSDWPSKNIFVTERELEGKEGGQTLKTLKMNDSGVSKPEDSFVTETEQSLIVDNEEEVEELKKDLVADQQKQDPNALAPGQVIKTRCDIQQINISLIQSGKEVITVTLHHMISLFCKKRDEMIYEATLGRLQIDNQSQMQPLFPVLFKPKCTVGGDEAHDHWTMEGIDPFFQFYCSMKTNIPNVQYVTWFEFLIKEMELQIELDHLMEMLSWTAAFNKKFNQGLAASHNIFEEPNRSSKMVNQDLSTSMNSSNVAAAPSGQVRFTIDPAANQQRPVVVLGSGGEQENALQKSQQNLLIGEERKDNEKSDDEIDEEQEQESKELVTWRTNLITKDQGTVYIQHYKGSPLLIEISIFHRIRSNDEEEKEDENSNTLLNRLGLNLISVECAPMKLNALEIDNIFGTSSDVGQQLSAHYMSNIRANALSLIGASVIGNPTDFVNTLGTGARQFYYEPAEGLMQGPIQGGIGVIKGAGKFVGYAGAGVAGLAGKTLKTLNDKFLILSFDREYRAKNQLRNVKDKPQGFFDGVGKGFKSFGRGLWDGTTGLVTQPIKGAKEDGVKGLGMGMVRGLTGTVTKPVHGTVDIIAKTLQGVEAIADGTQCKPNNVRNRLPRAFYDETMLIRNYNLVHAAAYRSLRDTTRQANQHFASLDDPFFGAFQIGQQAVVQQKESTQPILMISKSWIVGFNEQNRVQWAQKVSALESHSVSIHNQSVLILRFRKGQSKQGKDDRESVPNTGGGGDSTTTPSEFDLNTPEMSQQAEQMITQILQQNCGAKSQESVNEKDRIRK